MPEVATPNQGEREFETGTDEFFKAHSELTAAKAQDYFSCAALAGSAAAVA